jgi:hypothetical protein
MKLEFFRRILEKILKYQTSCKPSQWEPSYSVRMDRQTDMTKLIVAFHNFANAPKERNFLLFQRGFFFQFVRNKLYREACVVQCL